MRTLRSAVVLLLLVVAGCGEDAPLAPSRTAEGRPAGAVRAVPGEFIVVFRRGAPDVDALARELVAQHGGTRRFTYRHALRGFAAKLPDAAVEALRRHPHVAYVEPDVEAVLFETQADPPWGLDRIDQRDLPLDRQYVYDRDGAGVNAYVLDTGVRLSHGEFGGRARYVPNGTQGDFVGDGQGDAADCHGHGTHVAATLGGATFGVAKGVSLWAGRVVDCAGEGQVSMAIAAVDWITANAPRPALVNMSLGYGDARSLREAVESSVAAGVHYVVAAGNGDPIFGFPQDACRQSPAGAPGAVTVGATDAADREAFFSNYGTCVDLLAPGVDVPSAGHEGDEAVRTLSGTSMATPHVAGALATHLGSFPGDSPAAAAAALVAHATPDRVTLHPWSSANDTPNLLLSTSSTSAPPTLGVALAATPRSGEAPLAVSFSAQIGGSASGPSTVRFWWACADVTAELAAVITACGDPAEPAVGVVYAGTTANPVVATHAYSFPGRHTAKVLVERGSASPAEARIDVEVESNADLAVTSLTAPAAAAAGGQVPLAAAIENRGSDPAPPSTTRFYLSTNTALGADDALLGEEALAGLASGTAATQNVTVTIPATTAGGTWYVIARADAADAIPEPNESNNRRSRGVKIGPDLDVTAFTVPVSAAAGATIPVAHTVKNQGPQAAGASVSRFWLSANSSVGADDVALGQQPVPPLAAGASSSAAASLTIPPGAPAGTWYVIAEADADAAIAEAVETNNTYGRQLRIGPDLTVSSLSASAAGALLTLTHATKNAGPDPAPRSRTRFHLSANSTLDGSDVALGEQDVAGLAPGEVLTQAVQLALPPGTPAGTWYVIAQADAAQAVAEWNERNNTRSGKVTLAF